MVWLTATGAFLAALALVLTGVFAQKEANAQPAPEDMAYALSLNDELLELTVDSPNDVERTPITGLRGNETLIGIDFRPSSQVPEQQGALYGVGTNGNIYTIDTESGEATFQTRLFRANADGTIITPRQRVALNGGSFGVDFNPTVDRLRIVSEKDQNLRVNVDTGATIVDGTLSYVADDDNEDATPWVSGVAYTNNLPSSFNPPGTTANTTQLFDIDAGLDILAQQVDANAGDLATIGDLGPNVKLNTGFDVVSFNDDGPIGNTAYAALQRKEFKASGLFEVDLETGELTSMGRIGGPATKVKGLAVPIGAGIDQATN